MVRQGDQKEHLQIHKKVEGVQDQASAEEVDQLARLRRARGARSAGCRVPSTGSKSSESRGASYGVEKRGKFEKIGASAPLPN